MENWLIAGTRGVFVGSVKGFRPILEQGETAYKINSSADELLDTTVTDLEPGEVKETFTFEDQGPVL